MLGDAKNKIIIDVGGVVYELTVSLTTFSELPQENLKAKVLLISAARCHQQERLVM